MNVPDTKRSGDSRMMAGVMVHLSKSGVTCFVALALCLFASSARGQSFSVGGSVSGVGAFNTGILGTGIPGVIGGEVRVEALNLIARGVSLRADVGTQGADAMVLWRADLSDRFNLNLGAGAGWIDYAALGIVARIGLEYRFGAFGVTLEYGWRSTFETPTPTFRSQWALGFVWFL